MMSQNSNRGKVIKFAEKFKWQVICTVKRQKTAWRHPQLTAHDTFLQTQGSFVISDCKKEKRIKNRETKVSKSFPELLLSPLRALRSIL